MDRLGQIDFGTTDVFDALYDPEGRRTEYDWGPSEGYSYDSFDCLYDGDTLISQATPNTSNWLPTLYVWGPTGLVMSVNEDLGTSYFGFDPSGNCIGLSGG